MILLQELHVLSTLATELGFSASGHSAMISHRTLLDSLYVVFNSQMFNATKVQL
jgi:hypothetical protein